MSLVTEQMKKWSGEFGREYTQRNTFNPEELDGLYRGNYGVDRSELNREFIGDLKRDIRILEAGANIGNQLLLLQKMGFNNLYGIELNRDVVELSRAKAGGIQIIEGSILDIPFKDDYFDLVFTSGVLIHINPADIEQALKEVYRCSRSYIWGFEYFAEEYTEVEYRGNKNLLWKNNFCKLYLERFGGLQLIKERHLKYLQDENIDTMFLLKKAQA